MRTRNRKNLPWRQKQPLATPSVLNSAVAVGVFPVLVTLVLNLPVSAPSGDEPIRVGYFATGEGVNNVEGVLDETGTVITAELPLTPGCVFVAFDAGCLNASGGGISGIPLAV